MRMMEYGQSMLKGYKLNTVDNLKIFYSKCAILIRIDQQIFISWFERRLDLFYKPQDHPDWVRIHEHLEEIKLGPDQQVIDSYNSCTDQISTFMAGISKATDYKPGIRRKSANVATNAYYFVLSDKKLAQMEFFKANPDIATAKCFLNLMENKNLNTIIMAPLPSVNVNKII